MRGGPRLKSGLLAAILACMPLAGPNAQERVSFPSVGAGLRGKPDPVVDGYLFGPTDGIHPALVLLHGCAGLVSASGRLSAREVDWATRLAALGYVVLAVDSFTTRHQGQECSPQAPHEVTVGAVVATDPAARADAIEQVTNFLALTLQPQR